MTPAGIEPAYNISSGANIGEQTFITQPGTPNSVTTQGNNHQSHGIIIRVTQ